MTTQVIECPSACTITLQHDIVAPMFDLTPLDGAQIAAAIVAVWVVGWAIRMVIRAMNVDEPSRSTTED